MAVSRGIADVRQASGRRFASQLERPLGLSVYCRTVSSATGRAISGSVAGIRVEQSPNIAMRLKYVHSALHVRYRTFNHS